ncbi:MAG: ABC transporter permease subunit [Acidimicrobiales bacterium]
MTTTIATASASARGDLGRALLAEWTKFRTLRSTYWTLIVSVVVTVTLGASLLGGILEEYDAMTMAEKARFDPASEGLWYHGLHLGQVTLAVLGVLVATGEYGTGTIRATLAAIPSRIRVLAAKMLGFGALTVAIGAILAFVMFAVAQPMLAGRGLDVPLTDPTALRGVGLAALATAGVALLGLGAGLLIRHTAGAISTVLIVMLGIPVVALFFPQGWSTVTRLLPADAGWAMFTPTDEALSLGSATAVFFGHVFGLLAAGAVAFARRDT